MARPSQAVLLVRGLTPPAKVGCQACGGQGLRMTAPGKAGLGSVESWPPASLTQLMLMAAGQASRRVSLGSELALSLYFLIKFYWNIIAFTMCC